MRKNSFELRPDAEIGRWRVLSLAHSKKCPTYADQRRKCACDPGDFWLCLCAEDLGGCGTQKIMQGRNLRSHESRSCGCLAVEVRRENIKVAQLEFQMVTVKGNRMTLKEAKEKYWHPSLTMSEYRRRRERGMSVDKALTTPYERPPRKPGRTREITVFGQKMTVTAALGRYGRYSRSTVYWRHDHHKLSWEEALSGDPVATEVPKRTKKEVGVL